MGGVNTPTLAVDATPIRRTRLCRMRAKFARGPPSDGGSDEGGPAARPPGAALLTGGLARPPALVASACRMEVSPARDRRLDRALRRGRRDRAARRRGAAGRPIARAAARPWPARSAPPG